MEWTRTHTINALVTDWLAYLDQLPTDDPNRLLIIARLSGMGDRHQATKPALWDQIAAGHLADLRAHQPARFADITLTVTGMDLNLPVDRLNEIAVHAETVLRDHDAPDTVDEQTVAYAWDRLRQLIPN